MSANVKWFSSLGMRDLEEVGGKNASLGEMISNPGSAGVRVPDGSATTASAFRDFVAQEGLAARITGLMEGLDTEDVDAMARVGRQVRAVIVSQPLPPALEQDVRQAYEKLLKSRSGGENGPSFAVRSSATAEDQPNASFPGQQETFLNIRGIDAVLPAIHEVFASLYDDRAIVPIAQGNVSGQKLPMPSHDNENRPVRVRRDRGRPQTVRQNVDRQRTPTTPTSYRPARIHGTPVRQGT